MFMKGRLNSTLWTMVIVDVVALFVVLWLAYSAGEQGRLPITDFGGLGQGSGLKLLFAFVIAAGVAAYTYVTINNRVLIPVKRLADFSERFAQGDYRTRATVDSADDFGFIAEQLNRAAE